MATIQDRLEQNSRGPNTGGGSSSEGDSVCGNVPFEDKSLKRRNFKKLSLPPNLGLSSTSGTRFRVESPGGVPSNVVESSASSNGAGGVDIVRVIDKEGSGEPATSQDGGIVTQLASLQLGVEFKLDLKEGDFETISDIGSGNGGNVSKVLHVPTKTVMAKKVIHLETKPAVRRQISRELHIMHDCDSEYIVSYYGGFVSETSVTICMEYMDCGSLDRILKRVGPISEAIIGKITAAVVEGLTYLYNHHRIIHRDVKPSNVLVNSRGQIKLCDFGVSGELINSIAETFVGTSTYMSPERIQGATYTVKGDVWSLGLTVLELAIGRFPFSSTTPLGDKEVSGHPGSILDLLQRIVNEDPPSLPENGDFSQDFRKFVTKCLYKEEERPIPEQLINDAFFVRAKYSNVSVAEWARSLKSQA
jgi:mitogen-activated protein kinase kinase